MTLFLRIDNINFAKRGFSQQLQDPNSSQNKSDKYLEVALAADEQVVATHGNGTEEFLLHLGSIVRINK